VQFDPGDAIKLFIIYSGKQQAAIAYDGRFISTQMTDISEFKEEYPEESGLSALWHDILYEFKYRTLATIVAVIGAIGGCVSIFLMLAFGKRTWFLSAFPWLFGISFLLMILGGVMQLVGRGTPL
jgi:hypothetical protein